MATFRAFRICALIALYCVLSACATPGPVPVTHVDCLSQIYKSYTQAEQAEAAKELESLGPDSELGKMFTDYGKTRAAQRACKGQ